MKCPNCNTEMKILAIGRTDYEKATRDVSYQCPLHKCGTIIKVKESIRE